MNRFIGGITTHWDLLDHSETPWVQVRLKFLDCPSVSLVFSFDKRFRTPAALYYHNLFPLRPWLGPY